MGRAGSLHAEIFRSEVSEARLVCVADEKEQVARQAGNRLNVDSVIGYEEALRRKDVDAVSIAVPTDMHSRLVLSALEAGKHIFVEKPLARSLEEARMVAERAASSELVVQVGYMRRFDKIYAEAKKKIMEGHLGKPILYRAVAHDPAPPPGWAADPQLSGGIFYDMLSHDFDMARYLISSEVSTVYALGSSVLYEDIGRKGDYDTVCALLAFESGAYGYVEGIRRSTYGYDLRTEVVGSEATVVVGNMSDNMLTFASKEGISHKGLQWFMERFRNAFVEEDRSFVESILSHSAPKISALDGLRAIEIAEACRTSTRERRKVLLSELR